MELTNKQLEGLGITLRRYVDGEKYTCISGYAGSGKAQPNSTLIPTPNGYKKLGELKVGDFVYNRFGQPIKIVGVYPQGELEVFEVVLTDGRKTLCNDEHIWSYYTSKGNLNNKTCKEMIAAGLKNNGHGSYKFKIPTHSAIQYEEKKYNIDPYVVGAFIGDGYCKERTLIISSENEEIPKIICEKTGYSVKKEKGSSYNWNFYLPDAEIHSSKIINRSYVRTRPQTQEFFCDYLNEICTGASEKRIPEEYKFGSIEQRYSLIQGLMDTEGSITDDGKRYSLRYTSTSIDLINDIKEILYSLGYGGLSISVDNRNSKYKNNVCYNLNINIPNEEKTKFFKLSRKVAIAEKASKAHKNRDYTKIAIREINDLHYKAEMTCIMVDDPEHLYLTNDYIVTHNTTLIKFIIAAMQIPEEHVAYVAYTGKAANVLTQKGCPNATTAHKLLYHSSLGRDGKYYYKPKESIPYRVVVVDEISMLPLSMWQLLLSHPVYVIATGDPG